MLCVTTSVCDAPCVWRPLCVMPPVCEAPPCETPPLWDGPRVRWPLVWDASTLSWLNPLRDVTPCVMPPVCLQLTRCWKLSATPRPREITTAPDLANSLRSTSATSEYHVDARDPLQRQVSSTWMQEIHFSDKWGTHKWHVDAVVYLRSYIHTPFRY